MTSSNLPTSVSLGYASISGRARFDLFFRPSIRSICLLLLASMAVFWLARRHNPWHAVAEIPVRFPDDDPRDPIFVPPLNAMLTLDAYTGINLVDLADGHKIRNIRPNLATASRFSPSSSRIYTLLNDGTSFAVASWNSTMIEVFDLRTGLLSRELPFPRVDRGNRTRPLPVSLSPDGKRLVTEAGASGMQYAVWDLTASLPVHEWKPLLQFDGSRETFWFNNSGTRLMVLEPGKKISVYDANDLHNVFEMDDFDRHHMDRANSQFISVGHLEPTSRDLISTEDGRVIDSVEANPDAYFSPDLSVRAVVKQLGGGYSMWHQMQFFDRGSNRLLKTTLGSLNSLMFFPDSRHYITHNRLAGYPQYGIYDVTHQQPLALLNIAARSMYEWGATISPDGRAVLVRGMNSNVAGYRLFRKAGWDCPESRFGVLAFPHTWLLALLAISASISLFVDARRRAAHSEYEMLPGVLRLFFVVSLLLTLHFIITACLGTWIRSPAPLLLVASIGLASGSTWWRWMTVLILATALVWCVTGLLLLRTDNTDVYPLFDRVYDLPHRVRYMAMLSTTAVVAIGIILLARPSRALG